MSQRDFSLTAKGPMAPDSAQIVASVHDSWKRALGDNLNTNPATPQGQIMSSQAAAIQDKNNQLLHLANMFNPETAEGQFQDALGRIYFLHRHPARATEVRVRCLGLPGTKLPGMNEAEPAKVRTSDGRVLVCRDGGEIGASDKTMLTFVLEEAGAVDIPAGAVTDIVRAIPGWDAASNPEAGVTGQNVESRAAFEARRYQSVALNARSVGGAVYARVAQLPGVLDVVVRQNRSAATITVDGVVLGPHSIYVGVLGGETEDIAHAIYESLSAGCDGNGNTMVAVTDAITGAVENVRFTRPESLRVGVRVVFRLNRQTPSDAEQRIKEAVMAEFYGENSGQSLRVGMGHDLFASRFYSPILACGVTELVSMEVATLQADVSGEATSQGEASNGETRDGSAENLWLDYLHIRIDQSPVLSEDDITIVVQGAGHA